jgi:hypothetical protein
MRMRSKRSSTAGNSVADDMIGRLLKRSRSLVALIASYLVALGLAIKVFVRDFEALRAQHAAVFWIVVLSPLIFIIGSYGLPRLLEKRNQQRRKLISLQDVPVTAADPYFRLDPYVTPNPVDFFRHDRAHQRAFEWIRDAEKPILFLSGASGAGKTSVLEAYVLPMLRGMGWRVVEFRGNVNLAGDFGEAIASPRRRGSRLLLVFDQFEEFVILEELARSEEHRQFAAAVRKVRDVQPPGVLLLFAFRTEYQSAVESLELDELSSRSTWIEIAPFSRGAARQFLQGAPESPSLELVERLLNGIDALDDTPGLYRPITLNMMGLMFQRFDREFTGNPNRLVQSYLEGAIRPGVIQSVAPRVVAEMITPAGTKRAQTVDRISSATALPTADVRACLNQLSSKGLVRRIGGASDLWELSHDFIARQFAILLPHLRPPPWRQVYDYATPILFALVLAGAAIGVPTYLERRAMEELEGLAVSITGSGDDRTATFCRSENAAEADRSSLPYFCPYGLPDERLARAAPLLRQLKIPKIDLASTDTKDLKPLRDLQDIRVLIASENLIEDLSPLFDMSALKEVDISDTPAATDNAAVRRLTSRGVSVTTGN